MKKTHQSCSRGFTALELLIVIAIIGILIAVAMTGISVARARARDNVRVSDIKNIVLTLQQYHDVCRQYPNQIYGNNLALIANGCPSGINWGTFIGDTVPLDPDGITEYEYIAFQIFSGSTCVGYHIGATLERDDNKALNTDDDKSSVGGLTPTCSGGTAFDGNPNPDDVYDIYKN